MVLNILLGRRSSVVGRRSSVVGRRSLIEKSETGTCPECLRFQFSDEDLLWSIHSTEWINIFSFVRSFVTTQ